jgi:FMN phosphatase YigB (HAD superfamily)
MAYIIFDLDHTVIDSTHRQLTRADGSLDLTHWRENCTREKIFADTLLPLADVMRRYYDEGKHTVIVCTSRICTQHDMDYLETYGLRYHHFLSRADDDMRGDAPYKVEKLTELAQSLGHASLADMRAFMYDDNLAVIKAMFANRVLCVNAIDRNAYMRKAAG